MEDLFKAYKDGKRGKFRRVDGGKVKFIRSEDGVVEKNTTSSADAWAQLDTPSAEVQATDGMKPKKVCKCTFMQKCSEHSVTKAQPPVHPICEGCGMPMPLCKCGDVEKEADSCDCKHEGVCKEAADCPCDCEDRAKCQFRADAMEKSDDPEEPAAEVCEHCGK